jgi:hypothetical protein
MLGFFPTQTVSIPDFPDEQWSITRVGRSKSTGSVNTRFEALVPKNTNVTNGAIVTIGGEGYFVTTLERSFINTVCQLRKANATIDIVRITPHFTGKVNDYDYEVPLFTDVTTFYEEITAKQQQYDMGLLAKTTRRFLVSMLNFATLDRIKLNGKLMQIDDISASKYPELYQVQTSNDTRPTKVIT